MADNNAEYRIGSASLVKTPGISENMPENKSFLNEQVSLKQISVMATGKAPAKKYRRSGRFFSKIRSRSAKTAKKTIPSFFVQAADEAINPDNASSRGLSREPLYSK